MFIYLQRALFLWLITETTNQTTANSVIQLTGFSSVTSQPRYSATCIICFTIRSISYQSILCMFIN